MCICLSCSHKFHHYCLCCIVSERTILNFPLPRHPQCLFNIVFLLHTHLLCCRYDLFLLSSSVYSRVLKKSSQELYGLICYAELRKKVGGRKWRVVFVVLFLLFAITGDAIKHCVHAVTWESCSLGKRCENISLVLCCLSQ